MDHRERARVWETGTLANHKLRVHAEDNEGVGRNKLQKKSGNSMEERARGVKDVYQLQFGNTCVCKSELTWQNYDLN